jgi:hypothetical protein
METLKMTDQIIGAAIKGALMGLIGLIGYLLIWVWNRYRTKNIQDADKDAETWNEQIKKKND